MKLTVAFITKNRCHEIKKSLEACFAQKFDSVQYVVVDNGSSDDTINYLKDLSASNCNFLKIYASKENLGVAGGRNKAFEISDGEYVFFLDDDAIIQSESLFLSICNYLEEHTEVGALALRTYEYKTNRFLKAPSLKNELNNFVEVLQFIGCAHVIRKSLFENENLYPARLGYGSEELYASMKIWKKGYSIHYLDNVLINHYPSLSNRMLERERQYNILTNIYIVKMLTYPFAFRSLTRLVFVLRLIKNGYIKIKDLRNLLSDIEYRYQKSEENRVSYYQMFKLTAKFGWKNIV